MFITDVPFPIPAIHTLGFDYLTIDPPADPTFPAHRELLARGCVILECLNLRHVPAGEYELLAAPIHVQGADAAWCRAVLRCKGRDDGPLAGAKACVRLSRGPARLSL